MGVTGQRGTAPVTRSRVTIGPREVGGPTQHGGIGPTAAGNGRGVAEADRYFNGTKYHRTWDGPGLPQGRLSGHSAHCTTEPSYRATRPPTSFGTSRRSGGNASKGCGTVSYFIRSQPPERGNASKDCAARYPIEWHDQSWDKTG